MAGIFTISHNETVGDRDRRRSDGPHERLHTPRVGRRYVGHVGTGEKGDRRTDLVKTVFASHMKRDTIGFNPFSVWTPAVDEAEVRAKIRLGHNMRIYSFEYMALLTANDQCYSMLMAKIKSYPDVWVVGGIRDVPVMG